MKRSMLSFVATVLVASMTLVGCGGSKDNTNGGGNSTSNNAAPATSNTPAPPTGTNAKKNFTLAVSIYAGWMPWYLANESGVLKKHADKYGITIDVKYMDYVPSIEAYVAGQADAAVMTNMEALDMPAAAGVETSVLVVGDFSNGNDGVAVRNNLTCKQLKGKSINLVEKTVSHYLLVGFLESCGLSESDVRIVNVSDADIAPGFLASKSQEVVVTWNPMLMEVLKAPGVTKIYDSSSIPGEVQDLLVANTRVLNGSPDFARALVGAWYEVMGEMSQRGQTSENAINQMAALAKTSPTEFKGQLKTTAMYYTAESALAFTRSEEIKTVNDKVRQFCFTHGLLGDNAPSADVVGISYPDGTVRGDRNNVKLHYVDTYMTEAAAGKLK